MRLLKILTVLVALAGLAAIAVIVAPSVFGQERPIDELNRWREMTILAGRGSSIGVSIQDIETPEAGGEAARGVVIDEVRPDTPAEKAGLKRGDVVVEFDGEAVRSARQFTRLVQETPPRRTVKVTILREGRRMDLQITPEDRHGDFVISGSFPDSLRDFGREMGRLGDQLPNFNFDLPGFSRRRLGVTVEPLTDQLADYFGAKDGVLVTSVADGSAAARAGIKAGDVITSVNGESIRSRDDLVRALHGSTHDDRRDSVEVTIGIVRDKKETMVKATLEAPRRTLRGVPA